MKILVLKETSQDEKRVAMTPDLINKYNKIGYDILVESNAGEGSDISDDDFKNSGAQIVKDYSSEVSDVDVIVKVQALNDDEIKKISKIKKGALLLGALDPYSSEDKIESYNKLSLTSVAAELFPRITRAQSMDILSSQSNLAGYRAVIDAAYELGTAMPMMMTAAGTVSPAKVMILGAGVAGLQAIATAKRLGAVVSAFDVRAAAKEQVESLGAKFIEVAVDADGEDKAGYAKEMSDEYKKRQEKEIYNNIIKQDIVITTALIPGKPAPKLISEDMVKNMSNGSVIIDMAAIMGGNCSLTKKGEIVVKYGVKILGYSNIASRVAKDASKLYAKNLYNFIELISDKEKKEIKIDLEDEIVAASLLTHEGQILFKK